MNMRGVQRGVAGVIVALFAVSGCGGSSGTKTLSADTFVSAVNTECRTASRAIDKIDFSDKNAISDASDTIQTLLATLAKLKAPKALQADFDDFTSSLGDQITQFGKLAKAVKKGDGDAGQAASDELDKLSKGGDAAADSLGAKKCVGVTGAASSTATTDTAAPDTTVPDNTVPDTTVPDTQAPDTTTVNTPLPIDTPVETVNTTATTTTTSSSGSLAPDDASAVFTPTPGYTWATFDYKSVETAGNDPVLGPIVSGYFVGSMRQTADPTVIVNVYVTILDNGVDWTPAQLTAYYNFELGDGGGTDITTLTLALPGQSKTFGDYTLAAVNGPGFGVAIFGLTSAYIPNLIDGFVSVQSNGMPLPDTTVPLPDTTVPDGPSAYQHAAEKAITSTNGLGTGSSANCDVPKSTDVGTTFKCIGTESDGTTHTYLVTIDKLDHVVAEETAP
ncbi:MAG: hypothetical protein JWN62_1844 [Acidimicrobiales bacterium]|nr:hypothetical protein [Acidimicrobiales bacterium]